MSTKAEISPTRGHFGLYDHERVTTTGLINASAVPDVSILTVNLTNEKSNRLKSARGHSQNRVRD